MIKTETFTVTRRDIPKGTLVSRKAAALLPMITVEQTRTSFEGVLVGIAVDKSAAIDAITATVEIDGASVVLPVVLASRFGEVEIGQTVRGSYVTTEAGVENWDFATDVLPRGAALTAV